MANNPYGLFSPPRIEINQNILERRINTVVQRIYLTGIRSGMTFEETFKLIQAVLGNVERAVTQMPPVVLLVALPSEDVGQETINAFLNR